MAKEYPHKKQAIVSVTLIGEGFERELSDPVICEYASVLESVFQNPYSGSVADAFNPVVIHGTAMTAYDVLDYLTSVKVTDIKWAFSVVNKGCLGLSLSDIRAYMDSLLVVHTALYRTASKVADSDKVTDPVKTLDPLLALAAALNPDPNPVDGTA